MRHWSPRRWMTAAGGSVVVGLALGLPTDVVPNPVFSRPVDITWWSYPVLVISAILGGLLLATYVREPVPSGETAAQDAELDERPSRLGTAGGLLSFFAIGCPVCNKVVVLAIGTTGALDWFAPTQPLLAVGSLVLLTVALRQRLRSAQTCNIPARSRRATVDAGNMSR
ncbi:MAG: hypothetical protein O3A28_09175 [Actinomycetota bacterium]|nr:hypothetical protein [Ilumatobacteraceae bacterium]MDA2959890.1 hypothetical protein [Actinomycetota bacterium]MDA3007756.1 hypothetical protein [Actinomycetota bacterium]MDA3035183.1 hypothetical protein [Actinomycetota bacterium]